MIEYTKLWNNDSKDVLYNYRIGVCHLNLNQDKTKAIKYLEYVAKKNSIPLSHFDLGIAYMHNHQLEEAIRSFRKYQEISANEETATVTVVDPNLYIQYCHNAIELIKHPKNVSIEVLEKSINSEYPDYNPYITPDESILFFSSRRIKNYGMLKDNDGFKYADMYYSTFRNGIWYKAKNCGRYLNAEFTEEVTGLSVDAKKLLIYAENDTYTKGRSLKCFSKLHFSPPKKN